MACTAFRCLEDPGSLRPQGFMVHRTIFGLYQDMLVGRDNSTLGMQGPFLEMAFPKQPFLNGRSLRDKNRMLGNLSTASALHKLPKPANPSSRPLGGIRCTSKSSTCDSRFWTCGSRSGPVFHADFTQISRPPAGCSLSNQAEQKPPSTHEMQVG